MAYRWRGRFFQVDPENPRAEGICQRCGFRFNLDNLAWQYAYNGSLQPQNLRILVCQRGTCNDPLNPQDTPNILPPDPLPVFNARPEPYVLDETSWMTTQDGDIIAAQNGDLFITPIPNPSSAANTTNLVCSIVASGGSVATAYLDLFDGDPATSGISILSTITGSATRTNIAGSLTTVLGIAQNTSPIIITASSLSQSNISYVGIYDAATGGTLLMSGSVSASPTIALGNPVQFDARGLQINLN